MRKRLSKLSALAAVGCICWLCGGCDIPKTQYSAELTELGSVHDTAYVPKGHGSDTAVGFTSGGDVSITPIKITIPERYAIVFKCEHGKFVIDGEKGAELYKRLERGDAVTIRYREVYRVTKSATNLADLDFLDATKRAD